MKYFKYCNYTIVICEDMKLSLNEKSGVFLCIILLLSINLVIFQYTVEIREPWFGELFYNENHTMIIMSYLREVQ